jgi:hypothetical protein
MRALFLGNSYVHRGPVPMLVERLAARAGHAFRPYAIAPGGATLRDHLMSDEVECAVEFGGWDALVLQEQSLRPTPTQGDPDAFASDAAELAAMFHDHNPTATVWLTQTWARHPDHLSMLPEAHRFYPNVFSAPAAMRRELGESTERAADGVRARLPDADVRVMRLGDAWASHEKSAGSVRLHDADGSHANAQGQWLNAMLWYREWFGELPPEDARDGVDPSVRASCEAWR